MLAIPIGWIVYMVNHRLGTGVRKCNERFIMRIGSRRSNCCTQWSEPCMFISCSLADHKNLYHLSTRECGKCSKGRHWGPTGWRGHTWPPTWPDIHHCTVCYSLSWACHMCTTKTVHTKHLVHEMCYFSRFPTTHVPKVWDDSPLTICVWPHSGIFIAFPYKEACRTYLRQDFCEANCWAKIC